MHHSRGASLPRDGSSHWHSGLCRPIWNCGPCPSSRLAFDDAILVLFGPFVASDKFWKKEGLSVISSLFLGTIFIHSLREEHHPFSLSLWNVSGGLSLLSCLVPFFPHHLELDISNLSWNFWFSIFSLTVLHLPPFFSSVCNHAQWKPSAFFPTLSYLRAFLITPGNCSFTIIKKRNYRCHGFDLLLSYVCILSFLCPEEFYRFHGPLQNSSGFGKLKWVIRWSEIIVVSTLHP